MSALFGFIAIVSVIVGAFYILGAGTDPLVVAFGCYVLGRLSWAVESELKK